MSFLPWCFDTWLNEKSTKQRFTWLHDWQNHLQHTYDALHTDAKNESNYRWKCL